ncbi:ABC transporter ATP-binding protein, partial [Methylobacterium goesingense]
EAVLRRTGFLPVDTGSTWRARRLAGTPRDGADLLAALRNAGVPIAEIRIRAPGLEAVYREALAEFAGDGRDGAAGTGTAA